MLHYYGLLLNCKQGILLLKDAGDKDDVLQKIRKIGI